MTAMCPPLLQPLFLCHFSLSLHAVLELPPLLSVFPLSWPPASWPPPLIVSVPLPPFLLPPCLPSFAVFLPQCLQVQILEGSLWGPLSSSLPFCPS